MPDDYAPALGGSDEPLPWLHDRPVSVKFVPPWAAADDRERTERQIQEWQDRARRAGIGF